MSGLKELCAQALARDPPQPVIEFEKHWITWGEMRHVADRLNAQIEAGGLGPRVPVAFVPRNRPSAIAALLGLLSQGRSVQMIYTFQSSAALVHDVERLKPAVVVAAAEDFSEELRAALQTQGMVGIALKDMDVAAVTGLEATRQSVAVQSPANPKIELMTSGTAGPPKQFASSYDLIAKHVINMTVMPSGKQSDLSRLPPTLFFMPLGNISGIFSMLPALLKGQRSSAARKIQCGGMARPCVAFPP
jgi:long-chain acyl-CoA synthetase